jgi:hypothetical protein
MKVGLVNERITTDGQPCALCFATDRSPSAPSKSPVLTAKTPGTVSALVQDPDIDLTCKAPLILSVRRATTDSKLPQREVLVLTRASAAVEYSVLRHLHIKLMPIRLIVNEVDGWEVENLVVCGCALELSLLRYYRT